MCACLRARLRECVRASVSDWLAVLPESPHLMLQEKADESRQQLWARLLQKNHGEAPECLLGALVAASSV